MTSEICKLTERIGKKRLKIQNLSLEMIPMESLSEWTDYSFLICQISRDPSSIIGQRGSIKQNLFKCEIRMAISYDSR